jgi:thiamine-phosphate pyrophosphorylase
MNRTFYKHYVFLAEINELIEVNLLKFKNINIIINIDQNDEKNLKTQFLIIKFAKKNKIPFLIKNNFQECIKYGASGIFIESSNKSATKPILLRKDFEIVGSAHNQLEYNNKKNQNCATIMLSPLFYNEKYSINKILNIYRFNLISLNWRIKLCALGGINNQTLRKLKLTKAKIISFSKLIYEPEIKKPAYNLM